MERELWGYTGRHIESIDGGWWKVGSRKGGLPYRHLERPRDRVISANDRSHQSPLPDCRARMFQEANGIEDRAKKESKKGNCRTEMRPNQMDLNHPIRDLESMLELLLATVQAETAQQ